MENLRFDKEDCFNVLVFTSKFIIENIFFSCVPIRYRNTHASLEELALRARVPTSIFRSRKLPLVFL